MPLIYPEPTDDAVEPILPPIKATPINERGVWRSAFDTENDVVALMKIIELQSFEDDPDFNLYERGKDDPLFQGYVDQFLAVGSDAEYDSLRAKLESAIASRRALEKGGFNAIAATMMAAIASPTILIPGGAAVRGVGAARGALRVGAGTALGGGVAVGIQESILQAAPNDRELVESLTNVGLGTLLAGGLGAGLGAVVGRAADLDVYVPSSGSPSPIPSTTKAVTPDQVEARIEELEAKPNRAEEENVELEELHEEPINPTQTNEAVIGGRGQVELEGSLGLANTVGRMSPTVRGYLNKYSNTVRDLMRRLDSGGLLFKNEKGEFVATPDVHTRAKAWEGVYYKAKSESQRLIRDYHKSSMRQADKMSTKDIMVAASDAINEGLDVYQGPDIVKEVARVFQEQVFKPFKEEAERLDFNGIEHWMDPDSYVPHVVRRSMVAADHEDFVQVLTEHFGEVLQNRVQTQLERLKKQTARREEEATDISLTPEEATQVKEELLVLKQQINDSLTPTSAKKVARANELREQAKTATSPERKKALRQQADRIEKSNKELRERYGQLKGIARRERNINKGAIGVQMQIVKKDRAIRTAEAQNLRSINALVVRANNLIKKKGRITAKELNAFEEQVQKVIKDSERITKKYPDYEFLSREATGRKGKLEAAALLKVIAQDPKLLLVARNAARIKKDRANVRGQITRAARAGKNIDDLTAREEVLTAELESFEADVNLLSENLAPIQPFKRVTGKDPSRLNAMLLDLNEARLGIVHRRALKIDKLQKQRDAIDPGAPLERVEEIRQRITDDTKALYDSLQNEGVEIDGENFNVGSLARKQAEVVAAKFSGEVGRVPLVSTILERGPELERHLTIDPLREWSNGRRFADFMERDLDILTRMYTRTVGSDFEVYREFGALTPFGSGIKAGPLAKIQEEFENARLEIVGKYEGKKLQKELTKVASSRRRAERDINAIVDRIRHLRGIPEDPQAIHYRAGRAVLNLNTLRLMGGVVIASVADPARIILKQGIGSVYRHGLANFFDNIKALNASRREIKSFAVGLDMLTHARLAAMADIFDDYAPGSKGERGLQFLTNNMGRIAMFDVWNSFWKQTAGVITMQRLVHDIESVVRQVDNVKGAERFLARAGIDDDMADRIWKQLTEVPEGAERYKGVLVPNTAEWEDIEAARAFGAAILRTVDDTIVTPGTERPLVMDGSIWGRMIFQFRSFAFASLTKTLMYGAQELKYGNLNIPVGAALSVGLGAMSWWSWANLAGGRHKDRMENADFDKWLDEAVNRSGLLGPVQEFINTGSKIPWMAPYVTKSGSASTRSYSPYSNPYIDAFGPTSGLLRDLWGATGTSEEPRESTINAAVRMTPFQNLFYLRPLVNQSKGAAVDALGL